MFFFTHISIANNMYKYLKEQNQDGFVPNRLAFIYGNVKPDMNELL